MKQTNNSLVLTTEHSRTCIEYGLFDLGLKFRQKEFYPNRDDNREWLKGVIIFQKKTLLIAKKIFRRDGVSATRLQCWYCEREWTVGYQLTRCMDWHATGWSTVIGWEWTRWWAQFDVRISTDPTERYAERERERTWLTQCNNRRSLQ